MKMHKLKKIASQNKHDDYFLQVCLLGLYSEWEGGIKKQVDELIGHCNEANKTVYEIDRRYFFTTRNLNNEEFKKLWKKIFDEEIDRGIERDFEIENSFFKQRNKYAHGDFESMSLEYDQFKNYCKQITLILEKLADKIDDFIERKKYIR